MPDDSVWEAGASGGIPESETAEAISAPAKKKRKKRATGVRSPSASAEEAAAAITKVAKASLCERWMFHRPGEYCKTCGKKVS